MWPVWIGLPLGLWDDLFSGAPIGTAVGLWTLASIAIAYSSQRIYWRGFFHDWAIAALLVAIIQSLAALITHPTAEPGKVLGLVLQQIIISALLVPLFMRLTGKFDTFRSEERRVGKDYVRQCSSRWSPYPYNNNTKKKKNN